MIRLGGRSEPRAPRRPSPLSGPPPGGPRRLSGAPTNYTRSDHRDVDAHRFEELGRAIRRTAVDQCKHDVARVDPAGLAAIAPGGRCAPGGRWDRRRAAPEVRTAGPSAAPASDCSPLSVSIPTAAKACRSSAAVASFAEPRSTPSAGVPAESGSWSGRRSSRSADPPIRRSADPPIGRSADRGAVVPHLRHQQSNIQALLGRRPGITGRARRPVRFLQHRTAMNSGD
jgi:hypothetical protein